MTSTPSSNSKSSNWHIALRSAMLAQFSAERLHDICVLLGLSYAALPGSGHVTRTAALIARLTSAGRLGELLDACARHDPHGPWAALGEAAAADPDAISRMPDLGALSMPPNKPWRGAIGAC